ncbi:MAG: DNA primase [Culicoidibacterales bacterium]
MAKLPEPFIDTVRQSADIVEVIGDYIALEKRGRNYFACCPFHNEDTPSMSVSPEKQIFHCFGCHEGGNVFSFVMKYLHISFVESVLLLAEKYGVTLPEGDFTPQAKVQIAPQLQRLYDINEWVDKLYKQVRVSPQGVHAQNYLHHVRQLSDETVEMVEIGFAPREHVLEAFLRSRDLAIEDAMQLGLVHGQETSNKYDAFFGRIVFPIHDVHNHVIGFSGRVFSTEDSDKPKYYNSPESPIFQKGKHLYFLHKAKDYARRQQFIVLTEGVMDVVAFVNAQVYGTVASLGTAFTLEQAKLLKRYTNTVVICYDGDLAGRKATLAAAKLLEQQRIEVKVAYLPDGQDPDDYGKQAGVQALIRLVQEPITLLEFKYRSLRTGFHLSNYDDRKQYIVLMLQELAQLENPIDKELYLQRLSVEFEINLSTLQQQLEQLQVTVNHARHQAIVIPQQQHRYRKEEVAERHIIFAIASSIEYAKRYQQQLNFLYDDQLRAIAYYILSAYRQRDTISISELVEYMNEEQELVKIFSEIVHSYDVKMINEVYFIDCMATVKNRVNDDAIKKLEDQLKLATNEEEKVACFLEIMKIKNKG